MTQLATIPPHPGVRKAAVLMVLLGDEAATAIYRCLPRTEVQRLTEEISELSFVAPMEAHTVLEEYNQLLLTHTYLAQGGTEYANNLLVQAFGEKDARALLSQVLEAQEARAGNLDSLQQADPPQARQISAGRASADHRRHSGPSRGAGGQQPAGAAARQGQRRCGEAAGGDASVLARDGGKDLDGAAPQVRGIGEKSRRAYAGVKAVADILNRTELATSKMVLENIEKNDPAMALSIRDLMFTFEDMVSVPEASLREWLSAVDKRTLALALKGAPGDLRTHVMQAMSSRAAEMLQEDMDALGPVRARDVLRAQQDAVTLARKLEQEGKVTLKADHNEEFIV